jgi:hypothetical protein
MATEGFTLATTLCSVLNALWLRLRLVQLLPKGRPPTAAMLRIAVATAGMAAAVAWSADLVAARTRLGQALAQLALPIAVGMVTYTVLHVAMGGRELTDLWRRRLRRRDATRGRE